MDDSKRVDTFDKSKWLKYKKELKTLQKDKDKNGVVNFWNLVFDEYYIHRIKKRYLDPIERIEDGDKFTGEGFTIVSILCCLVEMLESFEKGLEYSSNRSLTAEEQKKYYNKSGDMFCDFLIHRKPFCDEFKDHKIEASKIYKNIRCGLLHEARTKDGWIIRADPNDHQMFDFINKIIYRTNLLIGFYEYFDNYKLRLIVKRDLQNKFIKRIDSLFE